MTATRTVAGRLQIALDRTAFYPEGGGQPADRGLLDAARVLDVLSDDDGVVWHTIEGTPDAADEVLGQVDWPRRFDHMQQHHGQHLLSAAFEELFRLPTLAFHLGESYASIDLPGEVTEDQARAAEDLANQVIWEDRRVEARFVTPEELARLPLRKPPVVSGPVRVVSVADFDHSACGGTHPRSTGAVGLLHVRRRERRGGETRVEFLCGGRALEQLRRSTILLGRLAAELTVAEDEVPAAVERIRAQEAATRKRLQAITESWLVLEARQLVAAASAEPETPVVRALREDLDPAEGRVLASAIARAGAVAVLGLRGVKAQIIVARPDGHAMDCARVLRQALAEVGGKGGGQPALAQGGVPDADELEGIVKGLRW